jgi:urease accessory protein
METLLGVALVDGRSAVVRCVAGAPLRIVTPKSHGHAAWAYQSSYGGGFVGEDEISLTVDVEAGASLFLSSQASSKVYRATSARSTVRASVATGGVLVSWPDPIVAFAGASLTQHQTYSLSAESSLICVESWTAGRVASGERWQFSALSTRLHVVIDGERRFTDALRLTGEDGELGTRMSAMNAFSTIVLAGPAFRAAGAEIHRAVSEAPLQRPELAPLVVSSAWPWGTVVRVAAPTVEGMLACVRGFLQGHVAAALGDDPVARKW